MPAVSPGPVERFQALRPEATMPVIDLGKVAAEPREAKEVSPDARGSVGNASEGAASNAQMRKTSMRRRLKQGTRHANIDMHTHILGKVSGGTCVFNVKHPRATRTRISLVS